MALTKVDPTVVDDQIFSKRRLNVNGDMAVNQRGTKTGMQAGYGGPDRIRLGSSNSLGYFTMSQSSGSPNGFAKSFQLTTTTANASPAADAYLFLQYKFEGNDLTSLKWGTADAEQLTVSFWVKTNKTGTYNLELYQLDNSSNPHANKQYTVSSADTWEKKVVTFPAGNNVEIPLDNTAALNVNFWLGGGSNYTSGSASDGNFHSTNANRAAGNVNIADSTDNTFRITGLQIETGTQATPFEYRNIREELMDCQRYYQVIVDGNHNIYWTIAVVYATNQIIFNIPTTVQMRATPTLENSSWTANIYRASALIGNTTTLAGNLHDARRMGIYSNLAQNTGVQGNPCHVDWTGGSLALTAEL